MKRRTRAMCQTVTIVRAGTVTGEDMYGNATRSDATRTHVEGVSLQPVRSVEETLPTADRIITTWRLFCDAGVELRSDDRVQQHADKISPVLDDDAAALDLHVEGTPEDWTVTGTSLDHVEVVLRRWEG